METVINEYISRELVSKPELLPLENDSSLLESGILDSIAVLKLVFFLEEQFGVAVAAEDLVPENFETVNTICAYLHAEQHAQQARK